MKFRSLLLIMLVHFSASITAQHYLLPAKTSGFHLGASYSRLNSDYVNNNLTSFNAGYTYKGRLTGNLSVGHEVDRYYMEFLDKRSSTTYNLVGLGLSYLAFRQEQDHTLISFAFDAGYQFNRTKIKEPLHRGNLKTLSIGLSLYRNFHLSKQFSIIPSFGIGRSSSNFKSDPQFASISNSKNNYTYYNYQLTLKSGKFYLAPAYQVGYGKSYLTLIAGALVPIR